MERYSLNYNSKNCTYKHSITGHLVGHLYDQKLCIHETLPSGGMFTKYKELLPIYC